MPDVLMHHVLIDGGCYSYYRVTATAAWWSKQGRIPLNDILVGSVDYTEFLGYLEVQSMSCLLKFSNKLGVSIDSMIFVCDCPVESIWRVRHYSLYKSTRATGVTGGYLGVYIKHLNVYHVGLFPLYVCVSEAEADDTIAVLVQYFKYRDVGCVVSILANDSDYDQLLHYVNVSIYNICLNFECVDPVSSLRAKIYGVPGLSVDASYVTVLLNNKLLNFSYIPRYIQDRVLTLYHKLVVVSHTLVHRPLSIQLGLCCMNTKLRSVNVFCSRTLRLQTLKSKGLSELYSLARKNCEDLITHIKWNADHGIRVMRMSSDLFPHKNSVLAPDYSFDFVIDLLLEIGRLSRLYRQRLTFHPGQYDVIGTCDDRVFNNTLRDLDWHAEVLDLMGCDDDSVIVIHGGGVYGDKSATIARWVVNFFKLPERVRRRLVLENCERSFSVVDCLFISSSVNIPVVFDTHHFSCYLQLHPDEAAGFGAASTYMSAVLSTWHRRNIKPKFHVSEQCEGKQTGAHSDLITEIPQYLLDIPLLYGVSIDIMIEAKLKECAIEKLYERHPELNPMQVKLIKAKIKRVLPLPLVVM